MFLRIEKYICIYTWNDSFQHCEKSLIYIFIFTMLSLSNKLYYLFSYIVWIRNDFVKIQGGTPPWFHSGGGVMNATPPETALAPNTPAAKLSFNKQASKLDIFNNVLLMYSEYK